MQIAYIEQGRIIRINYIGSSHAEAELDMLLTLAMFPWDPDYNQRVPEKPMTITLKDKPIFHKLTKSRDLPGSPENPLTEEELFGKVKTNASLTLPKSDVDHACDLWWHLEK